MSTPVPPRDGSGPPPLRADAERNRARILSAARDAYAEHGLDVPLTEIAHRAGVGIATLYRRFPTGDDLISAVFTAKMDAYADAAGHALTAEDPWTGFSEYLRTLCRMQAEDAGFADILALAPREAFAEQRTRAYRAFTRLIARTKAAGALRADFTHHDLVLLLMADAGLVRATSGASREVARLAVARFTEYLIQSFRAPATGPLPPAPTPREMYRAMQDDRLTQDAQRRPSRTP